MKELLSYSFQFSIVGFSIVFAVLGVISVILVFVRYLDERLQKKSDLKKEQGEVAEAKSPTIDETTLVIISAAVATILKGRFHIRVIRRILPAEATGGSWAYQGRVILHGSHVLPQQKPSEKARYSGSVKVS